MIKIKIKSIWQGQVAIRDKYLKEANQKKEGLKLTYNDKVMEIPFDKITETIRAKSEKPFYDRFSNNFHYLIYFDWKPIENNQKELF